MQMVIACCDSERETGKQLEQYLKEFFCDGMASSFQFHYFESREKMLDSGLIPDIIFLHIREAVVNGIHIGNYLKETKETIKVFIMTTYSVFLDEAMRFHVFEYLAKPLQKEQLFDKLGSILARCLQDDKQIVVATKDEKVFCSPHDIVLVEAKDRKRYVYTVNGIYESTQTIQSWVQRLDTGVFVQTHRSYIVNLQHVCKYDHNTIYLHDERYKAYLTQRKYKQFHEAYLHYEKNNIQEIQAQQL